jgi:molybdate transport system substrate-binding protein
MRWPAVALALLALAGCGDDDPQAADTPQLTVSAAASLKEPFTAYGERFPEARARFSFAGSDELAAQIEQGVRPDVYAAANTKLPDELHAKGLVEKPTAFAGNRLVLAVPAESEVSSLEDLAAPGVKIAIGARNVPVGSYTRTVLDELPAAQRDAILAQVRSEEPDVAGITGKLIQGAVDAGFLYISDVRATAGELEAIELPGELQPEVEYGVAVVKGTEHPEQARAFVAGLLDGAGAEALAAAGFERP